MTKLTHSERSEESQRCFGKPQHDEKGFAFAQHDIFIVVSSGVLLRCLIHKDEVRKIITLLVKRQNSESRALSGAFRSLRLDQRACEAYPAVSLKCGGCSPVLGHSVRLTPQKSVPDRIGFSDNNPLNFWSSTTNDSNNAYNVNFSNGNVNNNNKSNSNYVRCVR